MGCVKGNGNVVTDFIPIMVFFCMQQQASVKAGQCQTTRNNVISEPSTSTAVINKALIDTLNRLQSAVYVCVCEKVCGGLLVCVCGGGGDIIHHYH